MSAAVVAGAGPNLGAALCAELARTRSVAGISRSTGYRADLTVASDVDAAFTAIERDLGPVDVVVYSAGSLVLAPFAETDAATFEHQWRLSALGAFHVAQRALPGMRARGRGAIGFVGATGSVRGGARTSAFASGKFALRGLAESLARELGPEGIHVAHFVVDGKIGQGLDAADLADTIVATLDQRTGWTFELDLRPPTGRW